MLIKDPLIKYKQIGAFTLTHSRVFNDFCKYLKYLFFYGFKVNYSKFKKMR